MSTPLQQIPHEARSAALRHAEAMGADATIVLAALDRAAGLESEVVQLRGELECARTDRAFRRLELTKAALAGLLAGRHEELPDASAVRAVSNTAVRVADAALAALQRIQAGGAA